MDFRSQAKSSPINIDLTPLINIVFLILIFFMLAGSLKPADPIKATEAEGESVVLDDLLVVVMTLNGDLLISGRQVDAQELIATLKNQQSTQGRVGIKPDSRLAAHQLLKLTERLRDAGFEEVTLIVDSP